MFETIFKIIVIALVLLVAFGIFGQLEVMGIDLGVTSALAMDSRSCHESAHASSCGNAVPSNPASAEEKTRKDRQNDPSESPVVPDVIPTAESPAESSPVDNQDTPEDQPSEDKQKCNNGEGNGAEGCSPAKSENANNDENQTRPNEDKSKSSLPMLAGLIFVTFKKGKREYTATVSSWSYNGKNLWLFIWQDDNNEGNCGYIPNAKVTKTSSSYSNYAHLGKGVEDIIEAW